MPAGAEGGPTDLDIDRFATPQIEIPGRVDIRAALGGNYDQLAIDAAIGQRGDAGLAGFAAQGSDQQGGGKGITADRREIHDMALGAARCDIPGDVIGHPIGAGGFHFGDGHGFFGHVGKSLQAENTGMESYGWRNSSGITLCAWA